MDDEPSRSHLKRPFLEDEDSNKPPTQKRVRFPKGKKVKPGDENVDRGSRIEDDIPSDLTDPRLAAKERSKLRSLMTTQLFSEENRGILPDISVAEVNYEENESFVDEGIQIEPFNLNQEREEGYFDAAGNFVEYVNDNEIKDAWLDSLDSDPRFAERGSSRSTVTDNEDDISDLSSKDIAKMKRRIANVLEPGETVLQALRRLKGTSNNRKEKMSAETKLLFDQLTEDAMKLMENGDYDVYHEKQEVFEREAEGYERLARARGEGTSISPAHGKSDPIVGKDFFSNGTDSVVASSVLPDTALDPSNLNVSTAEISSSNGDDAFDMFAEDDENATANLFSDGSNLASGPNPNIIGPNPNTISQPSSEVVNTDSETGDLQNDYVYDESSGYYYSSSSGYYYDPSSGSYCCAASGRWYSFNEDTGAYDEIQEAVSNES